MRPAFRPAHFPALQLKGPPQGKLTDSMLDFLIK